MRLRWAIAAAGCCLLAPATAMGATINVTTSVDEFGADASKCGLREAVQAAGADAAFGGCAAGAAGAEDVLLIPGGGYGLTRDGTGEDGNQTGDLDLDLSDGPIELRATGGTQATIDPGTRDRAIDAAGDTALELTGLRLINGNAVVGDAQVDTGGALRWVASGGPGDLTVSDSVIFGNFAELAGALDVQTAGSHLIEDSSILDNSAFDHGAVRSKGSLTVTGSTVSRNGGGGIYADGTGPDSLTLTSSAVTANQIGADLSPAGGVRAMGGAEITNSTISGNVGGFVGGIEPHGALTVRFSTIAGNATGGTGAAGGIDVSSASSVVFDGALLAGNLLATDASNCNADVTAELAPSLEDANGCGLDTGGGSVVGQDPQLAPLANNDGATQTRGLYPGSPAIDAAGDCAPLAQDQRGGGRPLGSACDIGAFEGTVPRPSTTPPPQQQPPKKSKKKKKCKPKGKGKGKAASKKRCKAKRKDKSGARPAAAEPDVIGRSVEGRAIRAVRLGDPEAERVVLAVGVIHGDERAGLEVTRRLRGLGRELDHAQIWVVDNLNPDGARKGMRRNAHSVDLNRNFPFRWRGDVPRSSGYYPGPKPASEPETRAIMALIRRIEPDVTIWYHQPWGAVLACRGTPAAGARYAKLTKMGTSCRGNRLRGTASSWQQAKLPGSEAFVVEIGAHGVSPRGAMRHARSVVKLAEGD